MPAGGAISLSRENWQTLTVLPKTLDAPASRGRKWAIMAEFVDKSPDRRSNGKPGGVRPASRTIIAATPRTRLRGNAHDQSEHASHPVFEAPQPTFHRRKTLLQTRETLLQARETLLQC